MLGGAEVIGGTEFRKRQSQVGRRRVEKFDRVGKVCEGS